MSMLVKKISLSLVLTVTALASFANPDQAREESEAGRGAVRQQQDINEKNGSRAARNYQSPESDRSAEEGFKKQSKLSPEERRALRRQINEAGQDLYIRKP